MRPAVALLLAAISALVLGGQEPQEPAKPRIVPFFSRIENGPGFFVECSNRTAVTVSSATFIWQLAVRIDGTVHEPEPGVGPGFTTDVAPGGTFRGIVILRQSSLTYFPAPKFTAMVRSARLLPLSPGRHLIAVRCGGSWSDDVDVYWEEEL